MVQIFILYPLIDAYSRPKVNYDRCNDFKSYGMFGFILLKV